MADVTEWLEELGLGEYADAFAQNKVDLDTLPELNGEDLRELGIPLGPRKVLMKAIARLRLGDESKRNEIAETGRAAGAERRQLTVMFCDLVGSTALSGKMDPEEYRDVLAAYRLAVSKAVQQYDGYIARYMGDGLLVYFGYPHAHEDDAERAVRSGLDVVARVGALKPHEGLRLQVRIGIASGLVVAGDVIVEGASEERAVLGDAPNLAARLQGIATPNSVIVSDATRRLVEGRFILKPLQPRSLKGIDSPVPTFQAVAAAQASRFEAVALRGLTAMTGRESELALLQQRWERAKLGEGQTVLLSGEPGIGKSRLTEELRGHVTSEASAIMLYQCAPYHVDSAYFPIIDQLQRAARFARNDSIEARLRKVVSLVERSLPGVEMAAPLIAALMSLPLDSFPSLAMTPQRQKAETTDALVKLLENQAAQGPVLIILEDAHWVDPSSKEVLDVVIDHIQSLRALLIITYRPEFSPSWSTLGHVTTHSLNRLGRQQVSCIVDSVTGGKVLPTEVLEQIQDRADGVPLFVEELTKTVLDAGILKDMGQHYGLSGPLPPQTIPATLHDSLVARLDRLALAKEITQVAACIGREFSLELLTNVHPVPRHAITTALDELVRAELIVRRGSALDPRYFFKHALIRDAAHESLLRSQRQELHGRVAEALLKCFPEIADSQPELIAYHYTEARMTREAIDAWLRAGTKAFQRPAFSEAVHELTRGLDLLGDLPGGGDPVRELALRRQLGPALIAVNGFSAEEVGENYTRAHELSQEIDESSDQFLTLWGLWVFHTVRTELGTANELGERLLNIACALRDDDLLLQAHHALETSLFWSGRFQEALEHMRAGLRLYDRHRHHGHAGVYGGHDPGVCCYAFQSLALWICGQFDEATESADRALALARDLEQPGSIAHVMTIVSKLEILRRNVDGLVAMAEELIDLASTHRLMHPLAVGTIVQGWSMVERGDTERGVERFHEGLGLHGRTGARSGWSMYHGVMADALLRAGQREAASDMLAAAFRFSPGLDSDFFGAELWTIKARIAEASPAGQIDEAQAFYRNALQIATQQRARTWELRALSGLVKLLSTAKERDEALTRLRLVVGAFQNSAVNQDLSDARSLLSEYG